MDLLRILDAKPEPCIVDTDHFKIDPAYQISNEYIIATPMSDFQKELIDQIVSLHYSDILRFFEKLDSESWNLMTSNRQEIIISSLQTLLKNTKLVCLHPYLLIDHFFPKSLTTRDLPNRLAETSGKFQIMNDILIQLDSIYNPIDKTDKSKKDKNINIGIIVPSGKAMDLVDALCIGHRCNLYRYSGIKLRDSSANQKKNMNLNLNVHLFPSNFEKMNEKELTNNLNSYQIKMNFIVLFDLNVDLNHQFIKIISNPYKTKFLKLIPINSVEHIENYFEKKIKTRGIDEFVRPITAAIVVLRDRVGKLPSILKPAYTKHLLYLKEYLSDPINIKWPLPELPSIAHFTSRDVERSLLTEVKFNFDNEEILKEEEENRPSVQDSLNTNFGGKTQMIGHIIQPRFAKKNAICKNYYDTKRLEKNYLMNPLNKDYENLTGISKEIKQHDVLTHTLIYHFDASIRKLIDLDEEVKGFNGFSDIRLKNFQVMIDAYSKLNKDVNDKEYKLSVINSEIDEYTLKTENLKNDIKDYETKIENITDKIKDEKIKEYINKDIEKYKLLEEISKLEQKLESSQNENKYMEEEINRAIKSIQESELMIEKQNETNENFKDIIKNIKNDDSEIIKETAKLDETIRQMDSLENDLESIKSSIEEALVNINESGHRSRHVNYYGRNNGSMSKKHSSL
ncbi:histone deacetylase [Pichia californica]|uniref:Histone deacetylase n=1 Tax=Pichia californica TaxID=460514 RepID=A0A9P6WGI6_9ASCO|nr:histone deacetylase [[Candida] californica]